MSSGKARGYAFDVDAWIQFHLLRLASFHPKTTKADIAVLAEIIQRYHGKFGNGWASHEHLGSMTGVHKASVIRAKRNLEQLGFITIVQAGRRGSATVYQPNFSLIPKKGSRDATETKGSTLATETNGLGSSGDTKTPEYGSIDATPSYLPDRPTKAESQIDRIECTAPVAPPADGLMATAAGTAQEWFEDVWKAYDHRQRKADARAAYNKLSPDADLHATIVAGATAWRASWAAQGNANAPRFTLAKWLEREEWECDPPTSYKPKERRAKPSAVDRPAPANNNKATIGSPTAWPTGWHNGEFTCANAVEEGTEVYVDLTFLAGPGPHFGKEFMHRFFVQSSVKTKQDEGIRYLEDLSEAVGLSSKIEDSDELIFKPLRVFADGKHLQYRALSKEAA